MPRRSHFLELQSWSTPGHLLGWPILTSEPNVVHLEVDSPLVRGAIVGRNADPTRTSITTYLFYKRPVPARVAWRSADPSTRGSPAI
jgi:hypothetical protein